MSYENDQLSRIIEGAILAAGEPLSVDKLHGLFEEHEAPEKSEIRDALQTIVGHCEGRGFQLVEVASGWRFQVSEDLATWVNRLWEEKPQKYSRALLETLALIAYRQPITRGDIEDVRGVAVSSNIIKTLVEREWVKVVGHRDVPGKPSLYATTRQFLDYFNLKSLDELPSLSELKDIDGLNGSLDLDEEARFADRVETADSGEEGAEGEAHESDEDSNEAADTANEAANEAANEESNPTEPPPGSTVTEALQENEGSEGKETLGLEAEVTESDTEILDDYDDAETVAGDTLAQDSDEIVPVQEAEMPFELDDEAGSVLQSDAEAEPTLEQEHFAEQQEEDLESEQGADDSEPEEQDDTEEPDSDERH